MQQADVANACFPKADLGTLWAATLAVAVQWAQIYSQQTRCNRMDNI